MKLRFENTLFLRMALSYAIIACLIFSHEESQAQVNTWIRIYGGPQYDRGTGIDRTYDDGYIVCGTTTSYSSGNTDAYLLRTDSNGLFLWERSFGGLNIDNATCVHQTPDSGFVISGFTNSFGNGGYDAYLVKTDKNGDLQWEKAYGGSDWDFGNWAEPTMDGGYILCGESYSFGNSSQAYVVKLNSDGDVQWEKNFGSSAGDAANEIRLTSDGGFIMAGYNTSPVGDKDYALWKLHSDGSQAWSAVYGGTEDDICASVDVCQDGGYLLAGHFTISGNRKYHFMKTAIDGSALNSRVDTPSTGEKSVARIRETIEGQYIMLINSTVGGFGGKEIWMIKYDPANWFPFVSTFGGTYDEEAYGIVQNPDSGFTLAGHTETFGTGPDNIFLARNQKSGSYNNAINVYVSVDPINAEENAIRIYPNPSAGKFFIEAGVKKLESVRIFSLTGTLLKAYNDPREIDLSFLRNGIYLLEIATENGTVRKRIMVQR